METKIRINEKGDMIIENARMIFRNFAGAATKFNVPGNRNFGVVIPNVYVDELRLGDWLVKELAPREEEDDPLYYIPVTVKYGYYPPKITTIASGVRTRIDEDTVADIDHMDVDFVDVVLNPYNWEVNGKSGKKAYLKSMFITLARDELEEKYAKACRELEGVDEDDDVPWN